MDKRRKWLIAVLLAAVTFAVYWPVGQHDFILFDDPQFITENPEIRNGLSWHSLAYAFCQPVVSNWHPVTTLSHILDCQIFGVRPGPQHLVSAGFHAVNCALLFLALTTLTGAMGRSLVVAALFGLHPLRVESVAWIAERKDVLSGLFFFLTIWAYATYAKCKMQSERVRSSKFKVPREEGVDSRVESREPRVERAKAQASISSIPPSTLGAGHSTFFYALSLCFFVCGLMSKPMLVTVPLLLLLLDLWPLRRMSKEGADSVQSSVFSVQSFRNEDQTLFTSAAPGTTPEPAKTARAGENFGFHRALLEKIPFFVLSGISCALTLFFQKGASAANAGIALMARVENAIESYFRYLGKLFWPTSLSIIYPHPATPYGAWARWPGWQIWLGLVVLVGISLVCILLVRRKPYLAVGWFWFLGMMIPVIGLIQVGEQAMADRYTYLPLIGPVVAVVWFISDSLRVSRVRDVAMTALAALVVLGCIFLTWRQLQYWQNTVTLFQHAIDVSDRNPSAEFSLGVGLEKQGNTSGALIHYRKALDLNPLDQQAHYNMGQLLRKAGQWEEAAEQYEATLQINPRNVEARLNLANVLPHLNRQKEAAQELDEALRIEPDSIEGLNNLAWILATSQDVDLRNGPRAVQLAERACELTHFDQTTLVGTLAAAYAEDGRFPEAIATAEKACMLAAQSGQTGLLQKNHQLLELYRSGKAYRETE